MRRKVNNVFKGLFITSAAVCVLLLAAIFSLLAYNSIQALRQIPVSSFFSSTWNPQSYSASAYGVGQLLFSSLMVTVGAMIIAVPLGIGTAAYMNEIAPAGVRKFLKFMMQILAGIPSVAIGFVGIVLIGPAIAKIFGLTNGFNALNGSILLAFMAIPTIISVSLDAMESIPHSYKEASLALGANRWVTLIKVIIPAAYSGIIAAIILGFGRAIGETMTVMMVTGNATAMPQGYFDPVRTLTATIAIELGEVPYGSAHYNGLFVLGLILFFISMMVNAIAEKIANRFRYKVV